MMWIVTVKTPRYGMSAYGPFPPEQDATKALTHLISRSERVEASVRKLIETRVENDQLILTAEL